jgi:hypothetical protein
VYARPTICAREAKLAQVTEEHFRTDAKKYFRMLEDSFQQVQKCVLGLVMTQQSVNTSFGNLNCELKASDLDFISSVPKTGLCKKRNKTVSIKS